MKPAENCLKKYFYAVSLNSFSILFLEFYSFMLITTPSLFFYSRHDNCQEQNLSIQGSRLSRIWSPFLLTSTIIATRCFLLNLLNMIMHWLLAFQFHAIFISIFLSLSNNLENLVKSKQCRNSKGLSNICALLYNISMDTLLFYQIEP